MKIDDDTTGSRTSRSSGALHAPRSARKLVPAKRKGARKAAPQKATETGKAKTAKSPAAKPARAKAGGTAKSGAAAKPSEGIAARVVRKVKETAASIVTLGRKSKKADG